MKSVLLSLVLMIAFSNVQAQLTINEGSNKNYSSVPDEEGEYVDWIELYNPGASAIDLYNYSLTDTTSWPTQWTFPHYTIPAGGYEVIFCSGKNYFYTPPFVPTINTGTFVPQSGWNTHNLTTPFFWDGVSNLLINVCSYNSTGYTVNSVFNQTTTTYNSSVYHFEDGSPASCTKIFGTTKKQRPNMKLNGVTVGTGTVQNNSTDYPAPYGNWYWGARNQFLIHASELTAAGLTAGNITSLAFDVVTPDPCTYDYIDISMNQTSLNSLTNAFVPASGYNFHTNFKIDAAGETISLYTPGGVQQSSLNINCSNYDVSKGRLPNASTNITSFQPTTPGASNNGSVGLSGMALAPVITVPPGLKTAPFYASITNPNGAGSTVRYTTNGSDPNPTSPIYNGAPIYVFQSGAIKAKAYVPGKIPSTITGASYLFNINHVTPILSLVTDSVNLYGNDGNFDNPYNDWLKAAHVDYFDSTPIHQLVFSQHAGMIQDGGAGGSRGNPQRSFRLELDNSVVGDGPVNYALIPDRPNRNKYGKIYLRNGSNQFLTLPYKDAAQVRMMAGETNGYYSSWRPVSVYVNGGYFGLYELREKFDEEYFKEHDGATKSTVDIYSLSYYYGSILRSVAGDPVDSFFVAYDSLKALNVADTAYWNKADRFVDQTYYNDYIIGQSWMANTDWPQNNIKIYRSDSTQNRFRFCTIDLELSLKPNSWTDCEFDHIDYLLNQSTDNPYINIWLKGMQNERFRNYFINRFADLMNTAYDTSRLRAINTSLYNQTVIEMPNEYDRWGNGNVPAQMNDFYNNYLIFDSQLVCRTTHVRDHILNRFTLPQTVDISLDVFPAGAGKIHLSTITPDTYPWTGVYFDGVPVKIEAIPEPGYSFLHWGANPQLTDTLNPVYLDTFNSNLTFKAYFKALPNYVPSVEAFNRNFVLYPSPARDQITLLNQNTAMLHEGEFEIVNMAGVLMMAGTLNPNGRETTMSVSGLSPGVYLVRIKNKQQGMATQLKFVKL
ncbi:MAG: CotH kinase family protein [Chitinophagaceae bacterium]|nr:CotH kinase family protein [Chitinophagaceae bacterium]